MREGFPLSLRLLREIHGVTARRAVETAKTALSIFARDRLQIQELGRSAGSAFRIHEALQHRPLLSIQAAAARTGLTEVTVGSAFERLCDLGVVREITGRKRDRLYVYSPYIELLAEGTAPLKG